MSEYASTATLQQIAGRLSEAEQITLLTHSKPDGDAIGSVLAMSRALTAKAKRCDILLMGPLPSQLRRIVGDTPFQLIDAPPREQPGDCILLMDTGALSQLEPLEPWLRRHRDLVIGIDHHAQGDDVAPCRYVDTRAASTTQILVPLLDLLECPLTGGIGGVAEALFVGLATDTGWFRFSKAEAEVFAVAARLLEQGVNKTRLYQIIEETYRPQRLALEARALASVTYVGEPPVAIMSLSSHDFADIGGNAEDITGLVNTPLVVDAVRASVLLTEMEPGLTKMSFRSKPPVDGRSDFRDVNELARLFGGGGHTQAAGARVQQDLASAREALIRRLEAARDGA